jgi:hypothetical protein
MLRERFSPSALTRLLNIPANGRFINTADVGMPDHEGQKLAEDRHPHLIYGCPLCGTFRPLVNQS